MTMDAQQRFKFGELTYSQNVEEYLPIWSEVPATLNDEDASFVRLLVSTEEGTVREPWALSDVTAVCFQYGLRATLHDSRGVARAWVDRDGAVTFLGASGEAN